MTRYTLDELERRAYIEGDTETADLLAQVIDGADEANEEAHKDGYDSGYDAGYEDGLADAT